MDEIRSSFFLILLFTLLSCSHRGTAKIDILDSSSIRFIADNSLPHNLNFKGTKLGGLSGLQYEQRSSKYYAVSDDRAKHSPARLYELELVLSAQGLTVKVLNVLFLKDRFGRKFEKDTIDFESIDLNESGDFIISDEGNGSLTPPLPPRILVFNKKGINTEEVMIPKKFIPDSSRSQGVRNNLAFESISWTPDKSALFAATENAIIQDDEISNRGAFSQVRLLKFKNEEVTEFVYQLGPVINDSNDKRITTEGRNGLVEIIALSEKTLITLERAWIPETRKQIIKIYKVSIDESSSQVQNFHSLTGREIRPVKKILMADLKQFVSQFKTGLRKLDNFEGLTLGPNLPNGNKSLIFVSDNNFNPRQRTLFLAFELL